jgi:hypothetical protein
MRHIKNIVLAFIIGILFAGLASQFTSTKLPPCDLVVKGIGISTYGCSNEVSSTYPCINEVPNSNSMTNCVQRNYYKAKTFPFGYKQHFGDRSNLVDSKPLNENLVASFATGFLLTIASLYAYQTIKRRTSRTSK